MTDIDDVLRCPSTHQPLVLDRASNKFSSPDGMSYAFDEGIGCFLSPVADGDGNVRTRDFYDQGGWEVDHTGLYEDTRRFVDTRQTSLRFTRACMNRLRKYFRKGGGYLLDAGSGPIAHDELLSYDKNFNKRICLDLSISALREAKRKLGDRGIYLQGDLTNLPIRSNSIDAVMSFHVVYQLPADIQAAAFREMWRVLKPGGVAVVVYWWADPKLPWKIERAANLLLGKRRQEAEENAQPANAKIPDHNPLSRRWFESQNWPFQYSYDTYRTVANDQLKRAIPDDWRGAAFLGSLMNFQRLAPAYCGKHGLMPAIIIRKEGLSHTSRHFPADMRRY